MKANIGIRRRLAPLLDNDLQPDGAVHRAAALAARARRSSTTATRSAWATTSGSVTATAYARRCSGRPTATPGFSTATPGRLHLPVDHGPGLRLPGASTSRPQLENAVVAAALDPADDPGPQAAPRVRPRQLHRPRRQQPQRAVATCASSATTSCSASTTCPGSRSRSSSTCADWEGVAAGRAARRRAVPADRRAALPAHPRRARLLLVPARRPPHGGEAPR